VIDALGTPQRILLLGGTSDIGLAIVRELLPPDRTTDVILAGRAPERLAAAAQDLTTSAGAGRVDVRHIPFDAEDLDGHRATVDAAWSTGDVDIVIVAFGQLGDQATLLADPSAAVRLTTINHTAAVSVGLHAAARMREQGHGHLIALSSIAAERARPNNFIYGASKAGFDAFFDGLGYELGPHGVTVTVLRPGFVRSRMTAGLDVPPLACDPADVATAAVAAVRRTGARYVSLPQRVLGAGLRMAPRAIVRRLP
jgi:decaprenylphospho-beta-D-erythro-pentofuranosid-2-ulose 2-reductase